MNRVIGFVLATVLILTASCQPKTQTPAPIGQVFQPTALPISSPAPDLSPYYDQRPPAAILLIGDQEQTASIGNSPNGTQIPQIPTKTRLPKTPTLPATVTRTVMVMENGLTWTECVVPDREYSLMQEEWKFLAKCVPPPKSDAANDKTMHGERLELPQGFNDFKITIGKDHFETRLVDYPQKGCCNYELLKNGKVILQESAGFTTYDPNLGFWNIGGKLVWELGGWTSVIVVDGIDFNDQYQIQGSYKPYEIKGKLIYIARQNDKLHVVYDGQTIGPEFDDISMPNCCGMVWLYRGDGQYWFVGTRGEEKVLVSIQ